jgi:hypothetical protein
MNQRERWLLFGAFLGAIFAVSIWAALACRIPTSSKERMKSSIVSRAVSTAAVMFFGFLVGGASSGRMSAC